MMGWVGSGKDFCGLGWVQKFWVEFWKSDPWPTLWQTDGHRSTVSTALTHSVARQKHRPLWYTSTHVRTTLSMYWTCRATSIYQYRLTVFSSRTVSVWRAWSFCTEPRYQAVAWSWGRRTLFCTQTKIHLRVNDRSIMDNRRLKVQRVISVTMRASCSAVYCNWSCLFVCMCVWGSVTISSSLHFGGPAPPGKGSAAGRNFLPSLFYSQRAVFASPLRAFFIVQVPSIARVTGDNTFGPPRTASLD